MQDDLPRITAVFGKDLYQAFLKKRASLPRRGKLVGKSTIIRHLIRKWVDGEIDVKMRDLKFFKA